jgi:Cu2+-exporting ATPase
VANAIGIGRLADRGLLVTRGEAVERLPRCEVFAFDKTGTLTSGELQLESVHPFGGLEPDRAVAVAAALEAGSEHPVGRAIRAAHPEPPTPATDVRNLVGQGISGRVDSTAWRIGRPDFALDPARLAAQASAVAAHSGAGRVLVALGCDDGRGALLVLRDELRPGARELAARLRSHGAGRLVVLSGDDPAAVGELGRALGFDQSIGGMSPADKLAWIRAQQAAGARVVMVGDGINDAPTLAAADVSLSFAQATELAQVHSGLLILRGDLDLVDQAVAVTSRTRRIIRQNLAWAAAYNFLAVPAAAMGLVAPWGAAIGMSLSSLFVVLNALRLNREAPKATA